MTGRHGSHAHALDSIHVCHSVHSLVEGSLMIAHSTCLLFHSHSLTHSLIHSLAHSLTHSLTYSVTHSLTPQLMHSFTPFQPSQRLWVHHHTTNNSMGGHACLPDKSSSSNIERLGQQHVGPPWHRKQFIQKTCSIPDVQPAQALLICVKSHSHYRSSQ